MRQGLLHRLMVHGAKHAVKPKAKPALVKPELPWLTIYDRELQSWCVFCPGCHIWSMVADASTPHCNNRYCRREHAD